MSVLRFVLCRYGLGWCTLWGVLLEFYGVFLAGVGLMYPGGVPGVLWASVGLWVHPRRGIDKGRNRAREYAEYSQKIKRPYKR